MTVFVLFTRFDCFAIESVSVPDNDTDNESLYRSQLLSWDSTMCDAGRQPAAINHLSDMQGGGQK